MFRADLHVHTNCSDGSMAPLELLDHAAESDLQGLSITDHDTFAAHTPELFAHAKKLGIKLIPGIELSCTHGDTSVHILGYSFDLNSAPLQTLCERHTEARRERNLAILANLKKHGIHIDPTELYPPHKGPAIRGRPHIAALMQKKGHVETIQEAFNRYLGDGQCCYEPGEPFPVEDTLDILHNAGGKAFLAHPHVFRTSRIIRELLEMDLDGIECYYGRAHPEESKKWYSLAKKHNLLLSGGSDFHGTFRPHIPIGVSWVDKEIFDAIYEPSAMDL